VPFKGINWKDRIDEAVELGKRGKTLDEIGKHFGVSRQRIQQVFSRYQVDPESIGVKLRTKRSRETEAARYWCKWGDKDQQLYAEKRQKYRAKRSNAKRAGVEFSIPFSELVFPTHCPVLGIELDYVSEGRKENSVSFDRIDPTKGYVSNNVVVVSLRANRIKNDGTPEEHQKIADFYKNMLT
jgi:hypothetical protein